MPLASLLLILLQELTSVVVGYIGDKRIKSLARPPIRKGVPAISRNPSVLMITIVEYYEQRIPLPVSGSYTVIHIPMSISREHTSFAPDPLSPVSRHSMPEAPMPASYPTVRLLPAP